jgi:hypothetical protein
LISAFNFSIVVMGWKENCSMKLAKLKYCGASAFFVVFLAACQPSAMREDTQKSTAEPEQQPPASDAPLAEHMLSEGAEPDVEAGAMPFIAVLKKIEPFPDALSTGVIDIRNGCLVVSLTDQQNKYYTAVLPSSYKQQENIAVDRFLQVGKRKIEFGREGSIPGGMIFIDADSDLQKKIPASCPLDLFGIGE